MKIVKSEPGVQTYFKYLEHGSVFEFMDNTYMSIEECYVDAFSPRNAVNLYDGTFEYFGRHTQVEILDCELHTI